MIDFEVDVPAQQAFDVWTLRCATWWPASHTLSGDPAAITFEPRAGGRILEHARGGAEHEWGTVLDWQPPTRLRYRWHPFFSPEAGDGGRGHLHAARRAGPPCAWSSAASSGSATPGRAGAPANPAGLEHRDSPLRDACDASRPLPQRERQFCAPPKPLIRSVMSDGLSTICEKRTTVTVSSSETSRP